MAGSRKHTVGNIKTILADKKLDSDIEYWRKRIEQASRADVEKSLAEPVGTYSFDKLLALVSPAAEDYLEQMAQMAHQLTVQRFGRTIKLYAPLYLSNYCVNSCKYCGFNKQRPAKRKRLSIDEAVAEANIIAANGFRDILLVSSEDREFISVDYLAELAGKLRGKFSSIAVEVYQMETGEYARLFEAGIESVTLYQETYNRSAYEYYHPAGPKADYDDRLASPDRMGAAGMRQIGLGVLLGLTDWRVETLALAEHGHYLMKSYWQSHISFSFPRLRPAHEVAAGQFKHLISDKNMVQMILALRLCFADAGLVISTRECAELRNHLIKLGVTKMSAGSKTNPGGYSADTDTTRQFEINDERSPAQICKMIKQQGFEAVWKDWDKSFLSG